MSDQTREELRKQGLAIRRKVLGDAYVDRALQSATEFSRPLQDLLNEYCWGANWGGSELTLKERSMITLAILTVLGRTHEIETHTRGALNNGLTEKQIAAVLLHAAIYGGVPAAVDGFRAASKVLAEKNAK